MLGADGINQGANIVSSERLSDLRRDVQDVMSLTAAQVKTLSRLLIYESSREYTGARKDLFTDPAVKENLVILASERAPADPITLRNTVACIGFAATRYDQYDDQFYAVLAANINSDSRPVKMVVARFVHRFPQFEKHPGKWDYIVSMPKLPPTKDSRIYFIHAIQNRIDEVPASYRPAVADHLAAFIRKDDMPVDTRRRLEHLLERLS